MNILKKAFALIIVVLVLILIVFFPTIKKLHHVIYLFDENKIVENFRTMDQYFPVKRLSSSANPTIYPKAEKMNPLPPSFQYEGKEVETQWFLEGSKTTGLIVIQNDSITLEKYYLGNTPTTKNISWSLAKSFIATLFGIAVNEGHIKDLAQPVEEYVPELKGSGYQGVSIKDVLQMSSGVKFNEDYGDFNSDINRWGRAFALGNPQDSFAASLVREKTPGTFHHYVSMDTHVLGMILTRATKKSITQYMQEKLWDPMGMEHDAYWVIDNTDMELAFCGLNTTLRDYAKLGSLYLNNGKWRDQQIISKKWIKDSTTPDAPHLIPGDNPNSAHELGYGYQWWIPESKDGEYIAQGVYNQTIYVNPKTRTVIVKLSANDLFNDKSYIPSQYQATLEFFRTIAQVNS